MVSVVINELGEWKSSWKGIPLSESHWKWVLFYGFQSIFYNFFYFTVLRPYIWVWLNETKKTHKFETKLQTRENLIDILGVFCRFACGENLLKKFKWVKVVKSSWEFAKWRKSQAKLSFAITFLQLPSFFLGEFLLTWRFAKR